jgi:thioredoxin reductase (NADPH)
MITTNDLRAVAFFRDIPDSELQTIAARGADVHLHEGDWVIQEGETAAFFVLLEGRLTVLRTGGLDEEEIGTFEPGTVFGETSLLLGSSSVASVRALEDARLLRLDAIDFYDLVLACAELKTKVIDTMMAHVAQLRESALQTHHDVVTIIGDRWDLVCHDVRDFLARNHVPFQWKDHEEGGGPYPVVVLSDGTRLDRPSFRELADRVGLSTTPSQSEYDVVIVGGGPAGLGAAVYGASEGLATLLVERVAPGGQAGTSSSIQNYLGFPAGISGDDLSSRALRQAHRFGADIVVARTVTGLDVGDGSTVPASYTLTLDGGDTVRARTVVLAMGLRWRRLNVPGAKALTGRGVYYGAARTEKHAVRGKRIMLVGGGNSAGQAAMLFADYAAEISIVIRNHALEETMSQYLIADIHAKDNIHVVTDAEVIAMEGDAHLERAVVRHNDTGVEERRAVDALFVFIGAAADTQWLPSALARDEDGYLCTGRDMLDLTQEPGITRWPLARDPFILETNAPGVFAVGDVRHASVKRVASAVGEGSMSIAFVHRALARETPVIAAR